MIVKISHSMLSQLSEFVASHFGLHFSKERWPDLQRGLYAAAQEYGCRHGLDGYVQELLSPALTQRQLEGLACRLTVGETYFFREKRSLEILERDIVPELIRSGAGLGRAIRIWSAGCATGEEPYSVAIVLRKLMGLKKWNVEILATDLNAKSLQKAVEGIYREWSFRGTPAWVRSAYCDAVGDECWAITPAIQKMVTFAPLNLMDDVYPPLSNCTNGFDVIFCRNVLMYLTPEAMRKVVRQLHRSLATDGWLIVSPTETSHELFFEFARVDFGDVTLYRKSATHSRKTLTLPSVVCAANGFSPQLTEQRFENAGAAMALHCSTGPQSEDRKIPSENAEPPAPSYGLALALHELGRYEDAQQVIAALLSQNGNDAPAMLLLARAYANQGKLAAALVWCDKAIAADKMAARAYYLRATILQEQGSLPEALFAFKQTVYAEPQFVLGHFSLGNLALNRGKLRESEKHFENVLLLLAQYEPEDIVPESEGLTAGRLREVIVSQRSGVVPIVSGPDLSRMFHHAGKPHAEQAKSR
jgi:chemotaxis protein methyltransferase CheR